MSTSISELEEVFCLRVTQSVKWGTTIHENNYGIYIISSSQKIGLSPNYKSAVYFNDNQINIWMQNAPCMMLYNNKPTILNLKQQLMKFWLCDEPILYIGKAEKQSLHERINQFYRHNVGKKSPHKGGYWLKLLSNLNDLYIHILPTEDSHKIEEKMLEYFMGNVSKESKQNSVDDKLCLPFANLQLRSGIIKNHGLKNHYK